MPGWVLVSTFQVSSATFDEVVINFQSKIQEGFQPHLPPIGKLVVRVGGGEVHDLLDGELAADLLGVHLLVRECVELVLHLQINRLLSRPVAKELLLQVENPGDNSV